MKKLILSSPAFTGEVHLLYGSDRKLVLIDMQQAELREDQILSMKNLAPVLYVDAIAFKAAFNSKTMAVVEGDYKVDFETFWTTYNKKVNKVRCLALWNKMSEATRVKAYVGLAFYNRHLGLNSWKNKADPENYLKKEFWLNDWN